MLTSPPATSRVLLLSGIPGAGKSTYADWLQTQAWGRVSYDNIAEQPAVVRDAVHAALDGHDAGLTALAALFPGFVLEWGFPAGWLETVQAMIGRGYNAWFFDADRDAALRSWHDRWGADADPAYFHEQVNGLDRRWPEIMTAYGDHLITTLGPDGIHLPVAEIDACIFGS